MGSKHSHDEPSAEIKRQLEEDQKISAATNVEQSYKFFGFALSTVVCKDLYRKKQATFVPVSSNNRTKQSKLKNTMNATMHATLGGGQLIKTVKLPEGEDLNEWIAVNSTNLLLIRGIVRSHPFLQCS